MNLVTKVVDRRHNQTQEELMRTFEDNINIAIKHNFKWMQLSDTIAEKVGLTEKPKIMVGYEGLIIKPRNVQDFHKLLIYFGKSTTLNSKLVIYVADNEKYFLVTTDVFDNNEKGMHII